MWKQSVLIFVLLSTCFLGSASNKDKAITVEEWRKRTAEIYEVADETDDLSGVKIPILESAELEKFWGKPRIGVTKDGSYFLQYADPQLSLERLVILGFSKPFPRLENSPAEEQTTIVDGELGVVLKPQKFKKTTLKIPYPSGVLRVPVHYFRAYSGGGADAPQHTTDTFMIEMDGVRGYYVVSMESGSQKPPKRFNLLNIK